jgi:hypothetical protein
VDSTTLAAQNIINSTVALLPNLLAAVFVFLLGWIIAIIVSRLVLRIFKSIKLEEFLKVHKVEDALGTVKISEVLAKIIKYYVLLIFVQAAVSLVELGTISAYLTMVLLYAPVVIAGVMLVLVAVIFGEYLKEAILELSSKSPLVKLGARGVKLVVGYIGVTMALATMGINTTLITGIFLTVIQAMAFGVALAVGIAFGLGGQEDAKDVIRNGRKNLRL